MALFTAVEAFEMAMEIEKNGEVFYNAVAAKAADAGVRTLFQELVAQEQRHSAVFQRITGNVKGAPSLSAVEYDEYDVYLKAALDSALFAGPDKALAEQAKDRQTALRMALGFEKDTLLFFYDLREMASEAEQKAATGIIREEKTHLRRLTGAL